MHVCVATSGSVNLTETFIAAHLKLLPFDILHVEGWDDQYSHHGVSLSDIVSRPNRTGLALTNLLPNYIGWRLRRRFFHPITARDSTVAFLKKNKVQVVLAEYGMIGAFLYRVCEAANIPLVVHFHGADISKNCYLDAFAGEYPKMFASCAFCVVVSEKMKNDLLARGCPSSKIRLCHYGPNERYFSCSPNYASNQILAVGRLTEKKAPYLTLLAFAEALKERPEIRLAIVGDGEVRGVCEDIIIALGLQDNVRLLGACSPDIIEEEFNQSFLFVQHSVRATDGDCEGTPVSILEAGAAALPVISTRHAGIVDVVNEGQTGLLCNERDIRAMKGNIIKCTDDRKLVQMMGEKARRHVRENFSIEKHVNCLAKTLSLAVTQHRKCSE